MKRFAYWSKGYDTDLPRISVVYPEKFPGSLRIDWIKFEDHYSPSISFFIDGAKLYSLLDKEIGLSNMDLSFTPKEVISKLKKAGYEDNSP